MCGWIRSMDTCRDKKSRQQAAANTKIRGEKEKKKAVSGSDEKYERQMTNSGTYARSLGWVLFGVINWQTFLAMFRSILSLYVAEFHVFGAAFGPTTHLMVGVHVEHVIRQPAYREYCDNRYKHPHHLQLIVLCMVYFVHGSHKIYKLHLEIGERSSEFRPFTGKFCFRRVCVCTSVCGLRVWCMRIMPIWLRWWRSFHAPNYVWGYSYCLLP